MEMNNFTFSVCIIGRICRMYRQWSRYPTHHQTNSLTYGRCEDIIDIFCIALFS